MGGRYYGPDHRGDSVDVMTAHILGIDHVGIAVPDLEVAIAFHTGKLGGTVTHREVNAEQGVEEVMISYGSGAQIQLLAPLNPESTIAKFIGRSGPGLQQLAYRVSDLDQVCSDLRESGIRLLYPQPRTGTAGSRINFAHPKDTGGVLIELVEPMRPGTVTEDAPDGRLTS